MLQRMCVLHFAHHYPDAFLNTGFNGHIICLGCWWVTYDSQAKRFGDTWIESCLGGMFFSGFLSLPREYCGHVCKKVTACSSFTVILLSYSPLHKTSAVDTAL
jgi:hypothetical protein